MRPQDSLRRKGSWQQTPTRAKSRPHHNPEHQIKLFICLRCTRTCRSRIRLHSQRRACNRKPPDYFPLIFGYEELRRIAIIIIYLDHGTTFLDLHLCRNITHTLSLLRADCTVRLYFPLTISWLPCITWYARR